MQKEGKADKFVYSYYLMALATVKFNYTIACTVVILSLIEI